jgi:hypothetical protein
MLGRTCSVLRDESGMVVVAPFCSLLCRGVY